MITAAIRPDGWNLPLLVHVAGAMILVGALAVILSCLVLARRGGGAALNRLGAQTFMFAAFPGFVLMRAGAEWIKSKESAPDDVAWIGIGYNVADTSLLLLIVAGILVGTSVRRLRRRGDPARGLATAASVLIALTVAGYVLAIWAMTTKPD
jgi:hypothetical protein